MGEVPRRQVLKWAGTSVLGYGLVTQTSLKWLETGVAQLLNGLTGAPVASDVLRFTRAEDMVDVRFLLYNLAVHNSQLVPTGQPAALAVEFASQATGEEAFGEPGKTPPAPGKVRAVLGGRSRIVLDLSGVAPIPITLDNLLRWQAYPLRVVNTATEPDRLPPNARLAAPTPIETAIEAVWNLILSPPPSAGWAHSTNPVTVNDRSELWHTRLAANVSQSVDDGPTVRRTGRFVWSPDFAPLVPHRDPFPMSLAPRQRSQLVAATSDTRGAGAHAGSITPIEIEHLLLSGMGTWLRAAGEWDGTVGNGVLEWRHRSTMGREHFVKFVQDGYLFPFGHRAAKVTITERKFVNGATYLIQREFIQVRQPVVDYTVLPNPAQFRTLPFRGVRLTTLTTPNLVGATPANTYDIGVGGSNFNTSTNPFRVQVRNAANTGNVDLPFSFVATDHDGQQVAFTFPLVFVYAPETAYDHALMSKLSSRWNNDADSVRTMTLGGQSVAMAPSTKPGDTSFPLADLRLTAERRRAADGGDIAAAALQSSHIANFVPVVDRFSARLAAAEAVSGDVLPVSLFYAGHYITDGFGVATTKGEVFAQVFGDPVDLRAAAGQERRHRVAGHQGRRRVALTRPGRRRRQLPGRALHPDRVLRRGPTADAVRRHPTG